MLRPDLTAILILSGGKGTKSATTTDEGSGRCYRVPFNTGFEMSCHFVTKVVVAFCRFNIRGIAVPAFIDSSHRIQSDHHEAGSRVWHARRLRLRG